MRCGKALGIGALVFIWVLTGWAQTYGPGEIQYGGITLRFSGRLTTAGTCSPATQPGPGVTQIQCQVPEGVAGAVELTATRTPAGAVNVRVEAPPTGWPTSLWVQQMGQWVDSRSPVASGWGSVVAQYRFTPPAGSVGRRVELRFKAWTLGVIGELELKVILDIVRPVTPTPPPTEPTVPPSYGPFTGTTDGTGRFEVPIPTLPNTSVTGKLTECTVRPLPNRSVSVTLVPKPGVTIRGVGDIGAVRVSSSGYIETEIVQLMLASSMDMWGRTYATADVGTVCLRPTAPPVTPPPVTPTGPTTGKTDGEGKFTATLRPGVTVTGRLTECTVKPLPNQTFTLTPVSTGKDITGFTFSVPGYAETTVTQFSKLSLFGLTWYDTGTVCLTPPVEIVDCEAFCKALLEGGDIREMGIFGITFTDTERYTECWCREIGKGVPETEAEKEAKRIYKEATGKEMVTLRDKLLAKCLQTPHVRPGDGITFQADYRPPYCVSYVEWFVVCEEDRRHPLMARRGESYALSGEDTASLWKLFRKPGEEGSSLVLEVVCKVVWCDVDAAFGHSIQLILGPKVAYPPDCRLGGG